jgi:outer membrane protein OmpA-like peptidoglycan-associated protein
MRPICIALAILALSFPAAAEEVSKEDIVCALNPKCMNPKTRDARGLLVTSSKPAETPLAVDLYVNFAYNSADLTSDARITLDNLGSALADQRLNGFTFTVAGHTDAKGSVDYNQKLSERRADAVRQYLVTKYNIEPRRLTAKGYGKSQLFDPAHPEDGVNRRVQVLNATASARAQ